MHAPTVLAAVALLLAGCSDAPSGEAGGTTGPSTMTGSPGLDPDAAPRAPIPVSLPVLLDGNLGSYAHYCVFPAGHCDTHVAAAGETDVVVEQAGANFTGLDLNLTWESQAPATDELVLGFMVMAECEGCDTVYEEVRGTSPLRATLAGENVPLNDTAVVHIYVYNPNGFQMLPGGAGYTLASVDLPFHLEGTVRVAVPAA